MAQPDIGPLLDEQLDELELICRAGENDGDFGEQADTILGDLGTLDYVLGWHDRYDRKLLEAARWALANGWTRLAGSEIAAERILKAAPQMLDALKAMLAHYGPPETVDFLCDYPADHPITKARSAMVAATTKGE